MPHSSSNYSIYALGAGAEQAPVLAESLADFGSLQGEARSHARNERGVQALSFSLASALSLDALRLALRERAPSLGIDFAALRTGELPERVGLLVMDMDSTLITIEVIDELAKRAGVGEQVAAITAAAMRGELDFSESLRQRVARLKGLRREAINEVADALPLNRGAEALVAMAKARGCRLALVSGGFSYFAERLQARLGLDYIAANRLEIVDGLLTGRVEGGIVHAERKAELLLHYARELGLKPEQAVAVGDGANDLKMMAVAGLGVALHAKPKVQAQAPVAINQLGLEGVGYLLGWA
ncbi:MAG: phosphoserine phosphatase SerB [Gammaproteobacteria bacterium]|nr:phosphoserine phosphatase SerB [Gammaproteobacteria bacterium]